MDRLFQFIKKYSYVFLFLLLETIALVLVCNNSYYQNAHIISFGNRVAGHVNYAISQVTQYFGLRHENELLAKENAALRARLKDSYISYDRRVFVRNDTVYQQRYCYTEAQVIKNSWSQANNYIMVNKGSAQGIQTDMRVISPEGIVGIVVGVSSRFATVMPVIHPDNYNSVTVKRTGSNGTLEWNAIDYRYASVIDIPTTHKLYKNDTIITSGLGNDYPYGIPVGYVSSLSKITGSGFYNIRIRLATDFSRLAHVYIITNRFRDEVDTLSAAVENGDL